MTTLAQKSQSSVERFHFYFVSIATSLFVAGLFLNLGLLSSSDLPLMSTVLTLMLPSQRCLMLRKKYKNHSHLERLWIIFSGLVSWTVLAGYFMLGYQPLVLHWSVLCLIWGALFVTETFFDSESLKKLSV